MKIKDHMKMGARLRLRRDSRNLVLGVAMTRFVVKSRLIGFNRV